MFLLIFVVASCVSWLTVQLVLPRLRRAKIVGRDIHKAGKPEAPEMGGLGIVVGFASGILVALTMTSFLGVIPLTDPVLLLGGLSIILLAGLIGTVDDLLGIRQGIKAILPAFAAVPLMAIRAGQTSISIPLIGMVDFWVFYPLVLVPLGVTVAANAANMLAGFNGLEVGLGLVSMGALAIIAGVLHETTALIILLAGLGALLGTLVFNWYPARILVGDVGTLSIGAIIAMAVIAGDFEMAAVIVFIPHAIDFFFKATHRFPTEVKVWGGELRQDGKLHCPAHGPVSLPQFVMKFTGGLHERSLVLLLMGIEAVFGLGAILLYVLR